MGLRSLYWGWGGSQEWAAALLGSHTPPRKIRARFQERKAADTRNPDPPEARFEPVWWTGLQ
jgi:hypothetical protein